MQSVATQSLCPKAFRWLYEGLPWLPVSRLLSLLTRSPLWQCWHRKWHPNRWQCQQCMRHMQPAQNCGMLLHAATATLRESCMHMSLSNMWHLKNVFSTTIMYAHHAVHVSAVDSSCIEYQPTNNCCVLTWNFNPSYPSHCQLFICQLLQGIATQGSDGRHVDFEVASTQRERSRWTIDVNTKFKS